MVFLISPLSSPPPVQVIALVLCCVAIVVNILCLMAILQIHGKLTAHFRLIISLASSDILIATSVMLYMLINIRFPVHLKAGFGPASYRLRRCSHVAAKALNTTALNISLLNLMGMAIDLYLAIVRPLHYPQLMDERRVGLMVGTLWVVAVVCGFSDAFSVIPERRHLVRYNFCEMAYMTPYQAEFTVFSIALVCLFIMVFIYVRIYVKINRRHAARCSRLSEANRRHQVVDFNRNRKALLTTLMIVGSFVVCWLPLCLFQVTLVIQVFVDMSVLRPFLAVLASADQYLFDLLLLNAIADPAVYAIRMPEVQFGYRRLWVKLTRHVRRPVHRWGHSSVSSCGDRKSTYPDMYPVSRQGSEMSRTNSKKTTVINLTMETKM